MFRHLNDSSKNALAGFCPLLLHFFYKGGLLRKKSKNVRNIHIQWNVAHDRNVAMVIIIFFSERLGGNANLRST